MNLYEAALQHLIKMAMTPGFREYAWHRAKEMDLCESGMWTGIASDLREAMASAARPSPGGAKP